MLISVRSMPIYNENFCFTAQFCTLILLDLYIFFRYLVGALC